jgi:hypothetical protein
VRAVWQNPDEQRSVKGADRTGTLISGIIAVAAVGALVLSFIQSNASTEVRELTLGVILVLVAGLLLGVGYSPLRQSWNNAAVKRNANQVATRNLPRLLELTNRFRILTSAGHQDSLAYAIFNIRTAAPFSKPRGQQNPYFYDQMMTSIEKLALEAMSFRLFFQLVRLLDMMISNFVNETQSAVVEIRSVQGYKTLLNPGQMESYNLTRSYLITFLTSWREFGDKLDTELGVNKAPGGVNRTSPYSAPIGYPSPPGEL